MTGRILVVDDYEPLRFLKSFILSRRGYEVLQAETGAEALSLVAAENPNWFYSTSTCRTDASVDVDLITDRSLLAGVLGKRRRPASASRPAAASSRARSSVSSTTPA